MMGNDAEAIAILVGRTLDRGIRWGPVDLSWDSLPGGWVTEDDIFRVIRSRMPRRLMTFSGESRESAEKLQAVREYLENGGSVSAAARAFGVSRPTVRAVKDGTYSIQHNTT